MHKRILCVLNSFTYEKVLMMVALALTTLTMSAQEESKFAVNAGVGFSGIAGSDADGCDNIISFKAGLSYDLGLSESFSVIPGVELVSKGYSEEAIDGDIRMTYLQIPVFAAFKLNISDDMKLAIKAGPYASYGLFGSDIEWDYGETTNVFDAFEKFDAGVIAGVSLEISDFVIGAEYSRGLTKLDSELKAYNQTYGLTFGYKF